MNKRDYNVVGNEGTDNQELAKGIAFIKSRRAELNVVQMVENMRDQAIPNGVIINDAYCDRSMTRDYDREALNAFFATLFSCPNLKTQSITFFLTSSSL